MDRREERRRISCDAGVRVRMRNEGKQLDPSKACQNRVGQERVTDDWRGAARLLALLQLFSWAVSHLVGYHSPGNHLAASAASRKQHTIYRRD